MAYLGSVWKHAFRLKEEQRGGWRKLGLRRVESVAEHSFALALLAAVEAKKRSLDVERAVTLALIHDLEEGITGDLTPEKKRAMGEARVLRERKAAMREILRNIPTGETKYFNGLWTDLAERRTKEARLIHELDKLEMAFQAREYAKRVGTNRVVDFFESAAREIKDASLRRELDKVR